MGAKKYNRMMKTKVGEDVSKRHPRIIVITMEAQFTRGSVLLLDVF